MSEDSAERFINACKSFGQDSARVRNLSPTALYLLAAPINSGNDDGRGANNTDDDDECPAHRLRSPRHRL
jgi:hypothetical protein